MTVSTPEPMYFPQPVTPDGRPNPELRKLAEENPVLRVTGLAGISAVLVSSQELVVQVLSDPARFSNVFDPAATHGRATLNLLDPPEHTRLRRLAAQAFTARRVAELVPGIESLLSSLLNDMAAAGPPQDLVSALAMPLPVRVICQILGVPQVDAADLEKWTHAFTAFTEYPPEQITEFISQMHEYMTRLVAERGRDLGNDVVSNLICARDGQDALTEEEVVATLMLLLAAGYETTAKAISRGVMIQASDERWPRLVSGELSTHQVTEEVLRHQVPIDTGLFRWATTDTEIGGVPVKAGQQVYLSVHLANFDKCLRQDPDRFDPERPDPGHVAFGHGIHFCLGAALARAEMNAVFRMLPARFPTLRLAVPVEELEWNTGSMLNAPTTLPVTW